jgi:hypothetical protein
MNMMKPSVTSFSGRENINDFRTMYAMTSTMLKWSEDDKENLVPQKKRF